MEAVRQWLQEGTNGSKFEHVVFSAKANLSLFEKHMDNYFPLQSFAYGHSLPLQNGTENEMSESDKPQNGTEEEISESKAVESKLESGETAHDEDSERQHNHVRTLSVSAIELEIGDESITKTEEPIPESTEPESDTTSAVHDRRESSVGMDTIQLELDDELDNIQSILEEMELENAKLGQGEGEEPGEEEEEESGLLQFLGRRSQAQEIQTSTSLSAHTSPAHAGLASEMKLSRSLPLLDEEGGFPSHFKLNPEREESEV